MSASEQPKSDTQREPDADEARQPVGRPSDGAQEIPLFLRDSSDGRKGNAQDEKDAVGE